MLRMLLGVVIFVGLVAMLVPLVAGSDEQQDDPWAPVRPLLGTWQGTEAGDETESHIERTYELIMDGKFVRSTTLAEFEPSQPNSGAELHQDIGFMSYDPDRGVLVLREFMSEGYVVTYLLAKATADSLVFVSESAEGTGGYGARLRYSLLGADEHVEELDLAPPGEAFFTCHSMRMKRASD